MTTKNLAFLHSRIISQFPRKCAYCFAYGSGVKHQKGYDENTISNSLIDLIFCVDDARQWHTENLQLNPGHYSGLKRFGGSAIATIQEKYGAKVYCNTLIPLTKEFSVKYGVISTKHLIDDLSQWTDLYVAGRLHKPVETVVEPNDPAITVSIQQNLQHSFRTALLLLPVSFTRFELFYTIANLSYRGDFRMIFGENKNKVRNIVESQMEEFDRLYAPLFAQFSSVLNMGHDSGHIRQDKAPVTLRKHLNLLPENLLQNILREEYLEKREDGIRGLSLDSRLPILLAKGVERIVWASSVGQSLKNISTAGLTKSIRYSYNKVLKMFMK